MYKRAGHRSVSRRRPAPSPPPSPPSALSSNRQPRHANRQHGHIGPADPQQHIRGQLGHMRTESPLVPPSSVQHSNDEGNIGESDSRFKIRPYGDSFTDATYVVRQLNKLINNFWRGQYITYGKAPKEAKDLWWNEFKRKFRWDETEDDEVKRIFKKKAGDHIRNVMHKAKTSRVKPDFITYDNWMEIKRTWETEKNKQISEQNKKNRISSEGFSTYAGGSINVGEHKKRMADELGREPTCVAIFERTFKKKDKTWTGDRARATKEKYDELLMKYASGGDGVVASKQ